MRFFLLALAVASVVACDTAPLEPLPFQVGIEASRTAAAPGDTINFLVTAQGGSLIGIITNYGDDSTESFGTSGARTARVTFRHAFRVRGMYTITAVVTDVTLGEKSAKVDIRVN